ncbi:putative AC transposase [Tanacetum coccineum]
MTQIQSGSWASIYVMRGGIFAYEADRCRQQFASFVIQEGLPFNNFDNPRLTKVIQNTLQPRYTQVSRATLKRDCMKAWKKAKTELLNGFENLNTSVNLTTDIWLAPHGFPGRKSQFPVLAAMAQDLLSVQASTIASEFALSTSGRILSIRRTRLTPASMEMCICLKDHLDAAEHIQHISSLEDVLEYEEQLHETEVATGDAFSLSDEEIALDEAASEARSSEAEEEDLTLEQALN